MFIRDTNAIPATKTFQTQLPCVLAHPELCATEHAHWMPQIVVCVKSLWEYLHRRPHATCYRMRVRSDTDRDLASWFFLSHNRAAHPRLNLVASAFFDESSLAVRLIGQESGFDWIMAVA